MSVLVLNGSPRSGASNTMKLTNVFLEGLHRNDVEIIDIAKLNIQPCKGCFSCWIKTPGKCCIADDMQTLFKKSIEADLVIWSFPLYYYGMPSQIKAFMDRRLPQNLPYITERENGGAGHPQRFDLSFQRHVLISTCGFFTTENNYEALIKQFDIIFGDKYVKILCAQGELFRVPQLSERTDEYLTVVKQAGIEYAAQERFSAQTEEQLAAPMFPKDVFMEMANADWDVAQTESASGNNASQLSSQPSGGERLLRQMSAIYSPAANAPKDDKTIEFYFTDTNETYQLKVSGGKSVFVKDTAAFNPYSVRIETPFTVWQDISTRKLDGKAALFQNKYRVLGDFSLMTSLMDGFSARSKQAQNLQQSQSTQGKEKKAPKKRSMLILLLPFIALWVLLPLFGNIGAFTAILLSACVPLLARYYRLSPFDTASAFLVSVLSVAFLAGVSSAIIVTVSYFLFGCLWLVSLFFRVPLCAWYSANGYGGDAAFDNPLFISTNRIIACVWGILYLCVSVFTWFVMQSIYASLIGLFNQIAPMLAGIFTAVFAKKYPAYYARRNK